MAEYNMPQYILREFKVTDARVSCGHRRCCGYWEGQVLDDLDFNLGHPGWKWGVAAAAPVPGPGTQEVGGWVTGLAGCQRSLGAVRDTVKRERRSVGEGAQPPVNARIAVGGRKTRAWRRWWEKG